MLDTDTASYVIKKTAPALDTRLAALDLSQVCIAAVTRAELSFGYRRLPKATNLRKGVERFLAHFPTLAWDESAADNFAEIKADLERRGARIGDLDSMIAVHAKAAHAILVTNNVKHFRLINGLAIENWVD